MHPQPLTSYSGAASPDVGDSSVGSGTALENEDRANTAWESARSAQKGALTCVFAGWSGCLGEPVRIAGVMDSP